jgi:hypothetical protein
MENFHSSVMMALAVVVAMVANQIVSGSKFNSGANASASGNTG